MDRNPQAEQMAHESMVRTLAAQAEALWPQERPLFERYGLAGAFDVLDVGCGTGEITGRLAGLFPGARILGVDILESHLETARARCGDAGGRLRFEAADAYALPHAGDTFHLGVARHVLQSVPDPHLIVAELARVVRPGGRIHVLAEDYGMIHFADTAWDTDRFWLDGPVRFGEATGSDMRSGRRVPGLLTGAGLVDLTADYLAVDPLRVPRATFTAMWRAWRDGYTDVLARHSALTRDEVAEHWRQMIEVLESPDGFGVWIVPVFSARVPA